QFRSDRDVTAVEEDVQIRAKQKAIRHSVRPRRGIRSDMCSLQDGQRALSADRTALLVSIRYKHAKSTLSEARAGKILRPIPRPFLLDLSQAWVERQASEVLFLAALGELCGTVEVTRAPAFDMARVCQEVAFPRIAARVSEHEVVR